MLYSVLIYGVDGVFDRLPEAEQAKVLAQHTQVQDDLKARGVFRGAIRLMPPSTAMHVRETAGQSVTLDGPFAETKEHLLGFYLIETDRIEVALEAAKALPQGIACMEVRPVRWGSDMLHAGHG